MYIFSLEMKMLKMSLHVQPDLQSTRSSSDHNLDDGVLLKVAPTT